ncbi:MAG: sugar ABC transporter permease [Anaerolineae bacterium]|nr:sugar ABC transporter permease [Anaerolineae bacterium]
MQARAVVRAGRRRMSPSERREAIEGYVSISPWLFGLVIFTLGPIVASLYFSFTEYEVVKTPVFIGLDNYQRLVGDRLFWQSLKVTGTYVGVSVPVGILLSFAVALLMNQKVRLIGFFRTAYYMPNLVPAVGSAILWIWIFNPEFGLLNTFLASIGIQGPLWLAHSKWALPALIIMSLWGVGGGMLIYLAGLQGIPTDLYEAAEVDGAGQWRRFLHVTVPQMTPVLFFNLVMGIIGSFQVFTAGYIMTGGGPRYATYFYVLYLYNNAFQYFRMGYASALAWILAIIILFFTLLVFRSSSAWVYYEGQLRGRG